MSFTSNVREWTVGDNTFLIPESYEVLGYLGSGTFGTVIAVRDTAKGDVCAIKKLTNIFRHLESTRSAIREMKLLRLMNHVHIVKFIGVMPPLEILAFDDLYLVYEIISMDLSQIIHSNLPLAVEHIQFFTYQLLQGLKYLHSAGVLHRDIKPKNLLVGSYYLLKIADFGSARVAARDISSEPNMTPFVTSRWYSAPEVIVGSSGYSSAIDMWAVGCVVAELLCRAPIFPGPNTQDQLSLICRYLGRPPNEFWTNICHPVDNVFVETLPDVKKSLVEVLQSPNATPEALDLTERLLEFNPPARMTAEEALRHPFLSDFYSTAQEVAFSPLVIPREAFHFELALTAAELKEEILAEIMQYQKSSPDKTSADASSSSKDSSKELS